MKKVTEKMFEAKYLGRPVNDFRKCDEFTINAIAFVCPVCGKLHIAHSENIVEYVGNTLECSCGTMYLLTWAVSHTERGHLDLHPGTLEHFIKVEQTDEPIRKVIREEGKLLVDLDGHHLTSLEMINNSLETQSFDVDFLVEQFTKDEYDIISNPSMFKSKAWYVTYADTCSYAKHWYSNAIALMEVVAERFNGSCPSKFESSEPKSNFFAKIMSVFKKAI